MVERSVPDHLAGAAQKPTSPVLVPLPGYEGIVWVTPESLEMLKQPFSEPLNERPRSD